MIFSSRFQSSGQCHFLDGTYDIFNRMTDRIVCIYFFFLYLLCFRDKFGSDQKLMRMMLYAQNNLKNCLVVYSTGLFMYCLLLAISSSKIYFLIKCNFKGSFFFNVVAQLNEATQSFQFQYHLFKLEKNLPAFGNVRDKFN